jgi:THAP4-like, heme-binding beta-barrel domain
VAAALHESLAALVGLVGEWAGRGRGEYPTIAPFEYEERVTFAPGGRPFIEYVQRTHHPDTGAPMHTETGYLRMPAPGRLEAVLAQPTGLVEVAEGTVEGPVIRLRSTVVGTGTAKPVGRIERDITVDGDRLRYSVRMAAVGRDLTTHLEAILERQG